MKMRLAAATTVLGSAVLLTAVAGSTAFAATATPVPSPTGTAVNSPMPSPTPGGSFSPVPSPTGGGVTFTSPAASPTGGSFSPVPSPTGGSSSPVPSPGASKSSTPTGNPTAAPIPDAPKEQWPQPTLSVEPSDLPGGAHTIAGGPLVPGGKPVEFTVTVTNPGPQSALVQPQLVIGQLGGALPAAMQKLEIQDENGNWQTDAVIAGSPGDNGYYDVIPAKYEHLLFLEAGQSVQLPVRLSATAAAPKSGWFAVTVFSHGVLLNADNNPTGRTYGVNFGFLELASTTATAAPTGASNVPSPAPTAVPAAVTNPQPAQVATVNAPSTTTLAAAKAATNAAHAGKSARPALASTGGGSDSLPIALTGAAVLTVGTATLLVLRRRKGDHA